MKTASIARTAAVLLAAALGGAYAQTAPAPAPKVMSDMAPLPAEDRASTGAIVLEEQPVLAKQELMRETVARNRQMMSTVMGAGPAPVQATDGKRVLDITDGKVQVVPATK
ncbi:hypothetical protein [Ramlibacter albus]|uniref:DUF4148 domain-containing protein n=1 Tax=Ramlibacter albus TaxID=2079448 RepID=A0A923S104_9BURK|nr:hypothetical protein [Ramlibacter albus]MBC5763790.1 hypothetical protein [Ramlibacter albus]